ncbi:MAG: NERD domain-containing protein [Oleispira sp.]
MDFSPLVNSVMSVYAYIVPLIVIIAVMKTAWFKGVLGEFLVNIFIKLLLDKRKYHLIKNVTLPTADGSTQIDHIIVSEFGIFVIETKNMKGWIFGSESQKQWTQKIFKHSSKFQNPLHQNYKHVKVLSSCLDINENTLFSVIAFVGDSTFKTPMPDNVTNAGGLVRYITSKKELILSQLEIKNILLKIESGRLSPSIKVHRAHVEHVKEIKQKKISEQSCPKCGSNMVIRTARKGVNAGNKFWGCTQFPQCKGVTSHVKDA